MANRTALFGSVLLFGAVIIATGACSGTDSTTATGDGGETPTDEAGGMDLLDGAMSMSDAPTPVKDAGPAACSRNTTPCPDGGKCTGAPDCKGGICRMGVCSSPSPGDGFKDGDETDIDCGGTKAPACADGKQCKIADDCVDGVCTMNVCTPPSCKDMVQNGTETGKDCGGMCTPCADNLGCKVPGDCASGVCSNNACAPSQCTDKVKNGTETDVDCGGMCPGKCDAGQGCASSADCNNLVCDTTGTHKCKAPTSGDGLQNGTETDVDCGGGAPTMAPACAVGKKCLVHNDCTSDGCDYTNHCAIAPSCAPHYGGDTCGAGETGTGAANGENHESCCASIPLLNSTTKIDKYEITAGRMREFLTRVNNDVNGWYQTWKGLNAGKVAAGGILAGNEAFLPTGLNTPLVPTFKYVYRNAQNQDTVGSGDATLGIYAHLGNGVIFSDRPSDFQGCYLGPGQYQIGHPTFWFDDTTQQTTFGQGARAYTQQQLDEKTLNCVTQLLLAAFCIWDGGRLPTVNELAQTSANSAWGAAAYPWGSTPTSNDTWIADGSGTPPNASVHPYSDPSANGSMVLQSGVYSVNMPVNDGSGHAFLMAPQQNTTNWNPFYPILPSGLRYFWPPLQTGNCGATDGTYVNTCPAPPGKTCPTNCGWGQNDESYEIAAPGRFINDKRANPNPAPPGGPHDGWFDLAANIMEMTNDGTSTDDANHNNLPTKYWVGGSFEGHGVPTGNLHSSFQFNNMVKYGKAGGRCAR